MSVAVVTGANRGIGLEVARQLADEGFEVIAGSRDLAAGEEAVADIDGVEARELDVADQGSVDAFAARLRDDGNEVQALINNAGIHYDTSQRALEPDFEIVEEAIAVNLLGPWRMTVALLPLMPAGGRVVNVSSGAGQLTDGSSGGTPAYSVTKAGLDMLTIKLAVEADRKEIAVNAVCPGWVATDMGGSGGRPVSEGARGIVWAATLPPDGPTGGFFRDRKRIPW